MNNNEQGHAGPQGALGKGEQREHPQSTSMTPLSWLDITMLKLSYLVYNMSHFFAFCLSTEGEMCHSAVGKRAYGFFSKSTEY